MLPNGICCRAWACDLFAGYCVQGGRGGLPLWREGRLSALQVGVGMMPRGEVALIVALVGLRSRIVLPATDAIVVFMAAVTTILAPALLRYLYCGELRAM